MPAEPSPAREPAASPAAAAQALSDAASVVAGAWVQPMRPDAYSRAVSQLHSVLRDIRIAIRGVARYQIIPIPPGPEDRGFAQHVTTSAAWLLGAWHSLDDVVAAEGLGPLPSPAAPGDVLCRAARDAITAWRQPSGTAADRDTTARQLITAIVFLSGATLSLAEYAPRRRTIDLYAVGAGLAEARVALASAIQLPAGQAIRHRCRAATGNPGAGNEQRRDHQRAARSPRPRWHQRPRGPPRGTSRPLAHHRFRGCYSRAGKQPVLLERQAVMADPAVPEWVPDFPPVRSGRIISVKAQDAARVWEQPVTPGEMLTIGKDLGSALGNTGAALARLAVYHAPYQAPADEWFRRYDDPDEPNIYIECAARALDFAGRDMTFALADHITRSGQPSSPALSAGARLAEATRAAYVIIDRPTGSSAGRDVAVCAFIAATCALDTALENLTAHASAPMSAILARQRVRLEQAHIALRESLSASAAGKDVSGGLAAAQSMRERQPILSHQSRPAPDASDRDAATLATADFPQPALGPASTATRQPAAQATPARLRLPARRPGTYGALP